MQANLKPVSVRMADLRIMSEAFGQFQKKNHSGYDANVALAATMK